VGTIRHFGRTVLLSYGVLAFSAHLIPATLILAATFFHPTVGIMGLAGNLISNLVAKWIHAHRKTWEAGVFGVSGILIGLALGMYAEPSLRLWIFLVAGAAFTGIISVMLGNFFARYDLPILSIPFMSVIWLLLLTIGISQSDSSSFPALLFLQKIDLWLFDFLPLELFEYVKMFGNILFQENLISGILVFSAILLYSRISALYGLWGGLLGMVTYTFIHGSLDGFHGLNYVLVALAFGGFFIVGNRHAFILTSLAIFLVGIVDQATIILLRSLSDGLNNELPSLVFAFNVVTLIFLFPLKMLPQVVEPLRLTPVPLYLIKNPETNLRWFRRWSKPANRQRTLLTLPFIGEWSVLQGNNGQWTHKGVGRYAWDFVVRDKQGYQTKGIGLKADDYYAFGLPVLAPAPGTVVAVENSVEDNPPQQANTERNWGNYVVIDHGNGEFSELSHFKENSVTVVPGQIVQRGDVLGYCGNSGRSPVPHIHYQLQSNPALGAPTLPATFAEGTVNGVVSTYFVPAVDDQVSPVDIETTTEWSLLGRETEEWVFNVQKGFLHFTEVLTFTTDELGRPAMTSRNNTLWRIVDLPTFIDIRPDFKTYPAFLSTSAWLEIVGEGLVLPKKLRSGFRWNKGIVKQNGDQWKIRTKGWVLTIDPPIGITKVEKENDPKFSFNLTERKTRAL